jgi:hypothetical protein
MNQHIYRNFTKLAFASAALLLLPLGAHAANFNFHVDLNVASLVGAANSPFFLDFQLNQGSGSLSNSATVTNFVYTGGNATGSAMTFGSGASGNISSTVLLNEAASPFNELYQGFSAGTTDIQFNVSLSQNSPGVTPDGFIISILDSEAGNPPIGTTDSTNSSMVTVPITSANTISDVQTFTSTSPAGATASAVPEPTSAVALLGGAGCLLGMFRRRARASA